MKVSLVVASGVHQGKVIAITTPQFVIGRDPDCQLRPASQAVSKHHCAVFVRDGKVFIKDYGSTNGTVLNEVVLRGEERPLENNDSLRVGPLDFTVRIEAPARKGDGTPLPEVGAEAAAALAAVKAVGSAGAAPRNPTPAPGRSGARPTPGSKEAAAVQTGSKESPALKAGSSETPALVVKTDTKEAPALGGAEEDDKLAAMLLGMDDGDVPQGSTVVEMPGVGEDAAKAADPKAAGKKAATPSREDTSSAASEILRKYMRRPK